VYLTIDCFAPMSLLVEGKFSPVKDAHLQIRMLIWLVASITEIAA
jgi:hypothetical protein